MRGAGTSPVLCGRAELKPGFRLLGAAESAPQSERRAPGAAENRPRRARVIPPSPRPGGPAVPAVLPHPHPPTVQMGQMGRSLLPLFFQLLWTSNLCSLDLEPVLRLKGATGWLSAPAFRRGAWPTPKSLLGAFGRVARVLPAAHFLLLRPSLVHLGAQGLPSFQGSGQGGRSAPVGPGSLSSPSPALWQPGEGNPDWDAGRRDFLVAAAVGDGRGESCRRPGDSSAFP